MMHVLIGWRSWQNALGLELGKREASQKRKRSIAILWPFPHSTPSEPNMLWIPPEVHT